jgi:hypothetical protein
MDRQVKLSSSGVKVRNTCAQGKKKTAQQMACDRRAGECVLGISAKARPLRHGPNAVQ